MCVVLNDKSPGTLLFDLVYSTTEKYWVSDKCLGCKKIKICEHKITGPVVWEDKIVANI